MDLSGSPVDVWIVPCQPRVSQNDVVFLSKVQHKEVLCCIPSVNSEMKFDLVTDHFSLVVGSISILGIHRPSEFLQQPIHPPGKVNVNTADGCSAVYQGRGFSNLSIFCQIKFHRDGDTSGQGGRDDMVGLLKSDGFFFLSHLLFS